MSKGSIAGLGLGAAVVFAVLVWAVFALLVGFGLIPFVATFGVSLPFWPTFLTVILANSMFGKSVQGAAK